MSARPRTTACLSAALITLALTACGGGGGGRQVNANGNAAPGSRVAPAVYVQSMCTALGGWKTDAAVTRTSLAGAARATGSLTLSKQRFVSFLAALTTTATHAADSLRAAGIPALSSGDRFAGGLVAAFTRATKRLAKAASGANAIPTTTGPDYQRAARALTKRIRQSLPSIASIARVTLARYPELAVLEAKDPACSTLAPSAPPSAPLVPGIG